MHIRVDGTSIVPGHSAGVEAFTYGLVSGLATATDHHIEVEVLAGTQDAWRVQVPESHVRWSEVNVALRSDTSMGNRIRRYVPSQIRSSRLARRAVNGVRDRARAQPSDSADVTVYPFSCVPINPGPSVLVLHDLRRFQPGEKRTGYNDIIEGNARKAAAITASWPHPFQQVLNTFPSARDKTGLIPLPAFHARPEGAESAQEDGLLLYPSSTAPHKNHATLLEGMSLLTQYRVVCPGPLVEPQASMLQKRATEQDLQGRVSFPGFVSVDELQDLYRRAWAVVVPSTWEAASGAIFEAFSWGLPVACADVEPLRAQVEFAGGEVSYFAADDPQGVATAVERIRQNYEGYAAASLKAGKKLETRTWAETAQDYERVLRWVAQGSVGPMPTSSFFSQT